MTTSTESKLDPAVATALQAVEACLPYIRPRPINPTAALELTASMCVGPSLRSSGFRDVQLQLRVQTANGCSRDIGAACQVTRDDWRFGGLVKVVVYYGPGEDDWDTQHCSMSRSSGRATPWRASNTVSG